MIDLDIWNDPIFADDVAEFRTVVRRYWKSNVKKYFSKREQNYIKPDGSRLEPKTNHRFLFAPFTDSNEPRLKNALSINWTPETGHIMVNVVPIMAKAVNTPRATKIPIDTRYGKNKPENKNYQSTVTTGGVMGVDIIELLKEGTSPSEKKYSVSIDARRPKGKRAGTSNTAWERWFSEFLVAVDNEIERLADKMEKKVSSIISGKLTSIEEF